VFPYDSPSVELLRLLDQSYVKGKKVETVEITEEEFNILLEKCELVSIALDSMVAIMVQRITSYQEQLSDAVAEDRKDVQQVTKTTAKTASLQEACEDFSSFPWPERYKQDVNALLDRIYQTHRPEQIVMLNYHTGGFSGSNLFQQGEGNIQQDAKVELYLVVLMKNKGPFNFKCKEQGVASAMVVYLNVDYVKKKLAEGDRFVHTLWTKGWVLRRKSTFTPSFTVNEVDWKREYEGAKLVWENAKGCMGNLNEVILETSDLMLDSGILLLKDFLEIGVHTYLQCAVGYIPKRLHLTELIDWSCITSTKLLDFTYPKSETERACLHLMFRPERIWWKNESTGLSKTLQSFYRDQANEMLRFFDGLCGEVLEELESKVEKQEVTEASV
ncbi:MAG TPA: hypothetical protein VN040_18720, partial [Pseudosphingobacterium sp.]|nr:hypothetical protein [Pseudosphingobacterium sp.]